MRRIALCLAAISGSAFCIGPAHAEFCREYVQVWSSAGRCDGCRITFRPTAEQRYAVVANNGWTAELAKVSGSRRVAGTGSWSAKLRHRYAGKGFEISFIPKGDHLAMGMLVKSDGRQRPVLAAFRCLDRALVGAAWR